MTFPHRQAQSLAPDAKITLYQLDLTRVGGKSVSFTNHARPDGTPLSFGGMVFAPFPVEEEGFAHNSDGSEVQPKLSVPRFSPTLSAIFREFQDAKGCALWRIHTYRNHLDDGTDPDPDVVLSREAFVVDRVVRPQDDPVFVIELSDPVSQAGVRAPVRTITRDYCPFSYRVWNPALNEGLGGFDYKDVFCPYRGERFFNENGVPVTDPARDVCGKQLRDCERRFTGKSKIPFGGFPGAGSVRLS